MGEVRCKEDGTGTGERFEEDGMGMGGVRMGQGWEE